MDAVRDVGKLDARGVDFTARRTAGQQWLAAALAFENHGQFGANLIGTVKNDGICGQQVQIGFVNEIVDFMNHAVGVDLQNTFGQRGDFCFAKIVIDGLYLAIDI